VKGDSRDVSHWRFTILNAEECAAYRTKIMVELATEKAMREQATAKNAVKVANMKLYLSGHESKTTDITTDLAMAYSFKVEDAAVVCAYCGNHWPTWVALDIKCDAQDKTWKRAQTVPGMPDITSCTISECKDKLVKERKARVEPAAAAAKAVKDQKAKQTSEATLSKQVEKSNAKKADSDKAPAKKRKQEEQQTSLDDEKCLLTQQTAEFKLNKSMFKYHQKYPDRKKKCLHLIMTVREQLG
jgi:hypothetical protein